MSHIEDLVQGLTKHTADPQCLPLASEQVIKDLKGIDYSTIVAFKVNIDESVALGTSAWPLFSSDTTLVTGFIEFAQVQRVFNQ